MQTLLLDEYFAFIRLETIYHRPLFFTCIPDLLKCIVILYIRHEIIVRYRTSNLAGSTTDTPGCIDKYASEFLGFSRVVGLYVDVGYTSGGNSS